MKKLFALLLAFCLLLSLPACGGRSKTAVGTWNSKLDLKNLVGDRLDEILDYLESTDVEVTLVMKEDKTFTMTLDGNGVASAVKKAATAFLPICWILWASLRRSMRRSPASLWRPRSKRRPARSMPGS